MPPSTASGVRHSIQTHLTCDTAEPARMVGVAQCFQNLEKRGRGRGEGGGLGRRERVETYKGDFVFWVFETMTAVNDHRNPQTVTNSLAAPLGVPRQHLPCIHSSWNCSHGSHLESALYSQCNGHHIYERCADLGTRLQKKEQGWELGNTSNTGQTHTGEESLVNSYEASVLHNQL